MLLGVLFLNHIIKALLFYLFNFRQVFVLQTLWWRKRDNPPEVLAYLKISLGETLPDIRQSKKLSTLYHLSLDELIDFDLDVQEIQEVIDKTNEEISDKVDWTKAWGKKYPILVNYQQQVYTSAYANELETLLDDLQKKYGYNELDAFLVLKDILAVVWKSRRANDK